MDGINLITNQFWKVDIYNHPSLFILTTPTITTRENKQDKYTYSKPIKDCGKGDFIQVLDLYS